MALTDKFDEDMKIKHKEHINHIKTEYARQYGLLIKKHLSNIPDNHVNQHDMQSIGNYILNYEKDLVKFGIEAWEEIPNYRITQL